MPPLRHSLALDARHFSLPLEVFEMCQDFEDGKTVMEWRERAVPKLVGQIGSAFRRAVEQSQNARAPLGMMLGGFADPFAMAGKGRAVRGQDQVDLEPGQILKRQEKLAQRIAAGVPADIGRNQLENLIAGKQHAAFASIKADMAGRVA